MATIKKISDRRRQLVRYVRKEFNSVMTVRKGANYIICQCKGCRRVFQLPYGKYAFGVAFTYLHGHLRTCREL